MNNLPVCIVTGGSLGIGLAVSRTFSQAGYRVYNLDITAPAGSEAGCHWQQCDVANVSQVETIIQDIYQQTGRMDVLISNAGVHCSATIEQTSEEQLDSLFAINVKGAYAAIRGVLPAMCAAKNGAIILMASDQAIIAKHNSFAYNLSKSALASMAKTTALDYAKYNIRVNAVCPGTIETPLYHQAIAKYVAQSGRDINEVHQEEATQQPLGRLGQPQEVADLCCFLASDKAKFITGSLQLIDGGYTAQ